MTTTATDRRAELRARAEWIETHTPADAPGGCRVLINTADLLTILNHLATAENQATQLRHLLGTHADGHRCTCTMTRPGDHINPPEWEQDPWCPTHPNVDAITADHRALEDTISKVRAYADERAAYGRRGRTVHSARIASDLHGILNASQKGPAADA